MPSVYDSCKKQLTQAPERWLVTGAAGFIGSHLVEVLLSLEQEVVGMDNFATGHHRNLDDVCRRVTAGQWEKFQFIDGDITKLQDCQSACEGIQRVLHQAALGSVPRSLADPLRSHAANVDGFINMLVAARDAGIKRFVYASSSSVYGDHPALPKVEPQIGEPLSPYAATKRIDEVYAAVFARSYGMEPVGLRYFNVFGPRQDPEGAYAAVIPKWFAATLHSEPVVINGDGETSRDFCYIANVVQANLLAAMTTNPAAVNTVYNVALGERTTLNQLIKKIHKCALSKNSALKLRPPVYQPERPGDVRHSLANISHAQNELGYNPTHTIDAGLDIASAWYAGS
jgi:UDP-N-acetylglucosamine 4-epimerase